MPSISSAFLGVYLRKCIFYQGKHIFQDTEMGQNIKYLFMMITQIITSIKIVIFTVNE